MGVVSWGHIGIHGHVLASKQFQVRLKGAEHLDVDLLEHVAHTLLPQLVETLTKSLRGDHTKPEPEEMSHVGSILNANIGRMA